MKLSKAVSITTQILVGIGDVLTDISGYKYSRRSIYNVMHGYYPDWNDSKKSNWLGKLESRNYIVREKHAGSDSIILTNKAKIRILENKIKNEDGLIRFVSFDIPEEKRAQRDQFRRTIKRAGFVQLQKSLWVTNKDVGEIVEIAAGEFKVDEYVVYIVAQSTNVEKHIDVILKKASTPTH